MPIPAYMSIQGARQGNITQGAFTEASVGNIYVEGHENEIMVQSVNHNISRARDSQSGQPTGQRVHGAFVVTKIFDKASAMSYQALVTGETLQVTLKFYRTSVSGALEHFATVVLEDAILIDIRMYMPHCQAADSAHLVLQEDLSFSYRKITWTHEAAGTSASDDWRKPQ